MTPLPQVTGPGRASPVPAATIDTFRAPYAGESFTAAIQDLHRFHGLRPVSGLGTPSPRLTEVDGRHFTTPQASLHATDRIVAPPLSGLLTLGFDPARFQTKPPACYRAPWRLPGPDFHRQATTSLRTRSTATSRLHLLLCWAHTAEVRTGGQHL